jgi:hypothetical protein
MSEKLKEFSKRVTRLADWQLRIRARYETMNGFSETAGLLHEMLAYMDSLEYQLKKLKETK